MSAENRQELRQRIDMLIEHGIKVIDEEIEAGAAPEDLYVEEIVSALLDDEFIYYNDVINWWIEVPEFDSDNYYGEPDIIAQMRQVLVDYFEEQITPRLEEFLKELKEAEDED